MSKNQIKTKWMPLIFVLIFAVFIHSRAYSTNDSSRMAAVESLVHRGTWIIDDSPFVTIDQIKVGEHFVSDKPPVLSFAAAGIYALLHHGLGLTLQSSGCQVGLSTHCLAILEASSADWAYFTLTFLLVTLPGTLILALYLYVAQCQGLPLWWSVLLTIALGFGTALFPFSVVFSNHVPATAALFIAFVLIEQQVHHRGWVVFAGLLAALSLTIDLSAGIFWAGLLIYLILRHRRQLIWFVIGCLPPFTLMVILDYQIVGNIWPPQLFAAGYDYVGGRLNAGISGFQSSKNIPRYAFDLLLGEQAVFGFYPLYLWYLYAFWRWWRQETDRLLITIIGICTLLYFGFFLFSTDNFGGFAFSPRWLLIPVPLLALFAIKDPSLYQSHFQKGMVIILAAASIFSTARGALNPWHPDEPLLRLSIFNPEPGKIIPVAISGYAGFAGIPPEIRHSFGTNTVLRRWFDARFAFVVPAGDVYWFIHDSTPSNPHIAVNLGLPQTQAYLLQANLEAEAKRWISKMRHEVFMPEVRSQSLFSNQPQSLPLAFTRDDDAIALLGYQIEQDEADLLVSTAWQIKARTFPTGERKVFLHLLTEDGNLLAQSDFFGATYDTLLEGDYFLQVQQISLQEVPAGRYWLQIGVYVPETGQRLVVAGGDRLLLTKIEVR